MPYFKWFGYDSHHKPHTGYSACHDAQELLQLLKQQDIECAHYHAIKHRLKKPCTFADRQEVLVELSQLLQAHIRLSQALQIISSLVKKEYIRQILLSCMRAVDQGKSFAESAETHPDLFDPLTIYALKAGHDSGFLETACTDRSQQLSEMATIRAKVRSALAMPIITGTFFLVMLLFLMLVILPQFNRIFMMLKTPLPAYTRWLLAAGQWLTLTHIVIAALIALGAVAAFFALKITYFGKKVISLSQLYAPLIGWVYQDFVRAQCLQSLSLLLRSGQTLSKALEHVAVSFDNFIIREQLLQVQQEVQSGKTFAVAIRKCPVLAVSEVENLLTIAHETAQLEVVLKQLSIIFRSRAIKKLDRITLFIQPVLLIFLGAAIGMVLLALYLPLLQIPQSF